MSNTVIRVENVSKQYRLGQVSTGTISHDINRWWHKIRGKENPYLKLGEANDRSSKGSSDYVWALQDINFSVHKGEVLGIIGRNGAGKSTLLKILSKVTQPSTGQIKVKGRIASLLEVGTGFHPELSGRDNVYLNGAILGMTKSEITKKFDAIVDFAGVERYIDTPVKRYSSGMYVRLAFAVAAHLEPEILILDEVLAVGDAEFQKKCLGKMKDVSENDGRTVLFVSHNMSAVKALCNRSVWLEHGKVKKEGMTHEIVREYLSNPIKLSSATDFINDYQSRRGNGEVRFTNVQINNGELVLDPEKEIHLKITAKLFKGIDQLCFCLIVIGNENSEPITNSGLVSITNSTVHAGSEVSFDYTIAANTFRTGLFPVYLWLGKKGELASENYCYDLLDGVYYFNINSDKNNDELGYDVLKPGGYFNFKGTVDNLTV
jgi:lipopolysaccharide transport system ATP-binding protein